MVKTSKTPPPFLDLGRYALHDAIASGGMATVHLGRMATSAGVTRTVAIKRMHPHLLAEGDFASMFLDEARLAMRIQHPNVVGTFDVIQTETELLLVMDFVLGESLDKLFRRARSERRTPPVRVVCSVLAGVLAGLHAAHEARDEGGAPLEIVHRDVSPQNVLVGVDGVPRVVDFGVAKAAGRLHTTQQGQIKGKLAYMAPEQLTMARLDRRVDVFAAAAVLWEGLAGQRLFGAENPGATVANVLDKPIAAPSTQNADVPAAVDAIVLAGLSRHPDLRIATAREMAVALERACPPATPREIGEWVEREAGDALRTRAALVAEVESRSSSQASTVHERVVPGGPRARAPEAAAPRSPARPAAEGDTSTESVVAEAAGAPAPGRWSRARIAVVVAAALLPITTLLARVSTGARGEVPPIVEQAAPPSASDDRSLSAASPSDEATSATAAPVQGGASAIATAASAGASAGAAPALAHAISPGAAAPGATAARTSAAHPSPPHPPLPRKPDCRNPFTLGAGGIRVPRPECF